MLRIRKTTTHVEERRAKVIVRRGKEDSVVAVVEFLSKGGWRPNSTTSTDWYCVGGGDTRSEGRLGVPVPETADLKNLREVPLERK